MSPKTKGLIIIFLIAAALIPAYLCMKWMERRIRPRESGQRFLMYLLAVLALVFAGTFLIGLGIRLLFPGA